MTRTTRRRVEFTCCVFSSIRTTTSDFKRPPIIMVSRHWTPHRYNADDFLTIIDSDSELPSLRWQVMAMMLFDECASFWV